MDDVTERTCGICLEESKDPLNLPCGHSFCNGCLNEWRSRYGEEEEMRRKCPICRARIPPSKEMVATLLSCRFQKKMLEDNNDTSSEFYRVTCLAVEGAEERVGADWDGVTVLEDSNGELPVVMPDYVDNAIGKGEIKTVLKWIHANDAEDRVNATCGIEKMCAPLLKIAASHKQLALMALILQLGADVDLRSIQNNTPMALMINPLDEAGTVNVAVRLLLSWGANFFPETVGSRAELVSGAREYGKHELANLLESELGGRRCEIVDLTSRPELNGKTCVADEYIPDSNQYKVTLETKSKEVMVLSPSNLKRRDRTPQDCGYYIQFKNGRTIRHDFDSSEDCQAFVAALNKGEAQPVVTEEAEARAEQAAAELLAELGLDDSPKNKPRSDGQVKKSKKKKGGKKKKK